MSQAWSVVASSLARSAGTGSVAVDPTRLGAVREQGLVGDDQVDHHPHPNVLAAGVAFEDGVGEQVGHQLTDGPGVAVGDRRVRLLLQRGEHRDPGPDRQQGRQLGHHVGCRPQGDPAVFLGTTTAFDERLGVEPVGELLGLGFEFPDPHSLEPVGVTSELRIDGQPVFQGQAGGLAGHHGGGPFGDPTGPERGHRVRQLVAQNRRESHVALSAVRGLPPRQRHLPGHAAALPFGGTPAAACSALWEASNTAVTSACSASAAHLRTSS